MPPLPALAPDASGQSILTLEDFGGGEFGAKARWLAAANQFTGSNVVLYADGSIGPRNGVNEVVLTGTTPTGEVLGTGYNNGADAAGYKDTWFIIGSTAYAFDRDTGACASAGSVVATPASPPQMVERGTDSYLSIPGGGLAKIAHSGPTASVIATPNSPGLTCFAQYGDRFVAGGAGKAPDGTTAPPNRLYYSVAGNPESWDALGYLDVGDAAAITALVPQRTHLLICKGGPNGQWWVLTGVPGVNDVLRPVLLTVAPSEPDHAVVLGDGIVGYAIGSSATGSIGSIGLFDGSQVRLHPHLQFGAGRSGTKPTFAARKLKEPTDWFVKGGRDNAPDGLALFTRGAWTLHTFEEADVYLVGFCSSFTTADFHMFTDGGGVGTPRFFRWAAYNNRPAYTSDGGAQPGDESTTPFGAMFSTAEFVAPSGSEVLVRAVTVDFRKWNTGSPATNHFDLSVVPTRLYETGDGTGSVLQAFDEAGSAATTALGGTRARKKFSVGDQLRGDGFYLAFTNLRGVAIERIQVHLDLQPATA